MSQFPDKLFRDKLNGFPLAAPEGAWNKVDTALRTKKRSMPYLWVAASVTLLLCASLLIFRYTDIERPDALAVAESKGNSAITQPQPEEKQWNTPATEMIPIEPVPGDVGLADATPKLAVTRNAANVVNEKNDEVVPSVKTPDIQPLLVEEIVTADVATLAQTELPPLEEVVLTESLQPEHQAIDESAGITIVFTAEEVHEKYLIKNKSADATSSDEKSSTLKKLIARAHDLKHDQDPLGELRQKKNEIFALNFLGEKERRENK